MTCRGGWPQTTRIENKLALLELANNYLEILTESDISRVDGTSRNPNLARMILRSYARHDGTVGGYNNIVDDVRATFGEVSEKTIADYLLALKRLFVLDEIPAWNPNIRSKTSIRTTPKKNFSDPSIAVASLGISPDELAHDVNTFGILFENLCIHDLKIYSEANRATLSQYRDRYGLECDSIIHLKNGKYCLVEIKLGDNEVPEAEAHLNELAALINEKQPRLLGEPIFKMIITGTTTAYRTGSGVLVIPLGCLRD